VIIDKSNTENTSTFTTANLEDGAWILHFRIGTITMDDKSGKHYVWYVRNKSDMAKVPLQTLRDVKS
jgi:hypothetical protein